MSATPDRLYGKPGDENLHHDPEDVLTHLFDDGYGEFYHEPNPVVIEEHEVVPNRSHFMSADSLLEWLVEATSDGEVDEGWWDAAERASQESAVHEAMETAIQTLADNVSYHMSGPVVARTEWRLAGCETDRWTQLTPTPFPPDVADPS